MLDPHAARHTNASKFYLRTGKIKRAFEICLFTSDPSALLVRKGEQHVRIR